MFCTGLTAEVGLLMSKQLSFDFSSFANFFLLRVKILKILPNRTIDLSANNLDHNIYSCKSIFPLDINKFASLNYCTVLFETQADAWKPDPGTLATMLGPLHAYAHATVATPRHSECAALVTAAAE